MNHLLLNRLATSPFSREDYRVFAQNHFPLVYVFTQYLERLLLRTPDSSASEPVSASGPGCSKRSSATGNRVRSVRMDREPAA